MLKKCAKNFLQTREIIGFEGCQIMPKNASSWRPRLTFERFGRTKFIFRYLFIITTPNYAQKMKENYSRPSQDNRPRRLPNYA